MPDQADQKEAEDTVQADKEVQSHHTLEAYIACGRKLTGPEIRGSITESCLDERH